MIDDEVDPTAENEPEPAATSISRSRIAAYRPARQPQKVRSRGVVFLRILTFRADAWELYDDRRLLVPALLLTLLTGQLRYFSLPAATQLQASGLESLIYVLELSLLVIIAVRPLGYPTHVRSVLRFVAMTAPIGLLDAAPFAGRLRLAQAETIVALLTALVAAWRVALLYRFLERGIEMRRLDAALVTGALVLAVGVLLTIINPWHVAFSIVPGVHDSPALLAARLVLRLGVAALFLLPPLVAVWGVTAWQRRRGRK